MWYAILDIQNDVEAMSWLLFGSLQNLADSVLEQCLHCNPEEDGALDFEALEEEGLFCEAEDYLALADAECIWPDLLSGFHFALGDAEVSVHCLAEGYEAFRWAFERYDGEDECLQALCLPETLAPEEEQAFAEELADILFSGEHFDELSGDRRYVTLKEEDEE